MSLEDLSVQREFAEEIENTTRQTNSSSWRKLPYEPIYVDYHPCVHRWFQKHVEPRPPKRVRFKYRELSERLAWLSHPLIRRLLWLWIVHANTLSAERRARLKAILQAYGYSDEELRKYLRDYARLQEKNKKARATFENTDDSSWVGIEKRKKSSNRKSKGRRKRESSLEEWEGDRNVKSKRKIKGKGNRKLNKNATGHKRKLKRMGMRKVTGTSVGKKRVKDVGNKSEGKGKATGKNKKKGTTKRGRKIKRQGKGGDGDEGKRDRDGDKRSFIKGTKTGRGWPNTIISFLLQILLSAFTTTPDEAYLSRAREYFDVQAYLILQICTSALQKDLPDYSSSCPLDQMLVIACLNMVVLMAKEIATPAQAIPDSEVEKLLSLHGSHPKAETNKQDKEADKLKKTIGKKKKKVKGKGKKGVGKNKVKGKKKKGKGKKKAKVKEENIKEAEVAPFTSPSETMELNWSEAKLPIHPKLATEREEVDEEDVDIFMRTLVWYTPSIPEFIYNGPRMFPNDIEIIYDPRDTTWAITSIPAIIPDKLFPEPVPQYFENLRPTAHCYNDVGDERSPWYIMNNEYFYKPGPRLADMAAIVEQVEILMDILAKMHSIPNMSMAALLEMLKELTVAIKSVEEDISEADRLLDDKRTIILERMFVDFFGTQFRDYNEETTDIVETLCRRFAVIIRHVYRYTAYTLWNLQHRDLTRLALSVNSDQLPDDPAMVEAWNTWLAWLVKICSSGYEWAEWLEASENELIKMTRNMKPKSFNKWLTNFKTEAEDWFLLYEEEEENARLFAERALILEQVRNREVQQGVVFEWYPDAGRDSGISGVMSWNEPV